MVPRVSFCACPSQEVHQRNIQLVRPGRLNAVKAAMIPSVVGSRACRSEARPTSLSARTGFGSADLFRMRPRASTNASYSPVRRCGWVALPYRGVSVVARCPASRLWACGPVVHRSGSALSKCAFVLVRLTYFSLPNCMTSTRRFLQNKWRVGGHRRSRFQWACPQTRFASLSRFRGKGQA